MKIKLGCLAALLAMLLSACDSFDCKLENNILLKIGFYNEEGESVQLNDTLSVLAIGTDSILVNRNLRTHSLSLPMSHYRECDSLVLQVWGEDYVIYDTLALRKSNKEYFEGLNCPVKVKHELTSASSSHWMIKEIKIVNPTVDYTNGENIQIIMRSTTE